MVHTDKTCWDTHLEPQNTEWVCTVQQLEPICCCQLAIYGHQLCHVDGDQLHSAADSPAES